MKESKYETTAPATINEMSTPERRLLLFLEAAAVNCRGRISAPAALRPVDIGIIERWNESGFIHFAELRHRRMDSTHAVTLSDNAISLAHEVRRKIIERNKPDTKELRGHEDGK